MIDIERLARSGKCRKFSAGQKVGFLMGGVKPERVMYILITGRIGVFTFDAKGNLTQAGSVYPGEAFGGHEFFRAGGEYTYVADIASVAYILSEYTFYLLAKSQPKALFEILRAAYSPLSPPTAEDADTKPDTGAPDNEASASPAVRVAAEGLFPEGHKGYPGVTHPEYAVMTYKKTCTCPMCKKTFSGRRVSQSKLYEAQPTRYDLRKYYRDFQTEWYDFVTCPHCYFTTYQSYFQTPKPFSGKRIESDLSAAHNAVTLDFDAERDLDFVFAAHYLTLICAPGYSTNNRQLSAKAWGNLSWLYEDAGDADMMRYAAAKAAEAYEAVYMESTLSPVQEQVTCLSVAGMLYRAGVEGDMKKYLFKAKTMPSGNRTYTKLAEDLTDMLREDGAPQSAVST